MAKTCFTRFGETTNIILLFIIVHFKNNDRYAIEFQIKQVPIFYNMLYSRII